jgi:Tfp pilus assembly protein PilP
MSYIKSKSTKRFSFDISRNLTAKKAGSNVVTISTNSSGDQYSLSTTSLKMTVKEAGALQRFLNSELGGYAPVVDSSAS